ncbi:hypothetical protein CspeluHIS016_0304060 [Cutaneotrichosporon spelunceum]|uniref:Uncharacterized protein n=1 Tax=Cutaneotrichosporon spelunceum TaxID=1672016 RepID=A0AAD3TU55_9TREE|nr:hypothetical protein CspeluHIS016_0304060 [Cutaneotrichosporon spelunceum]
MSSLNSVVNKLVRAAASVSAEISDADLDAHVARILAEEAKANDSKWSELGLGAYLRREQSRDSPDPSAPKPNKRFLSSIIRQVDGHNNALLRQQAEAARQAQRAREPERKARGDGKAGANRLFGGALRGLGDRERKVSRSDRRERYGRDREEREVDRDDHSRQLAREKANATSVTVGVHALVLRVAVVAPTTMTTVRPAIGMIRTMTTDMNADVNPECARVTSSARRSVIGLTSAGQMTAVAGAIAPAPPHGDVPRSTANHIAIPSVHDLLHLVVLPQLRAPVLVPAPLTT